MRAIAIIPARLASTRLPGKPLRPIAGRPMIEHVYRAAQGSPLLSDVIVATDSAEIYDYCRAHDLHVALTSEQCRSGTDRVREVARQVPAEVYVNVQGDEPLARAEHIAALLAVMRPGVSVGTLKTPMFPPAPGEAGKGASSEPEQSADPNVVKVVTDRHGRALYFSRLAIPFDRDGAGLQLGRAAGARAP